MTADMTLLAELQERGYEPSETVRFGKVEDRFDQYFDFAIVRVTNDDGEISVDLLTDKSVSCWTAKFSAGTPAPVILHCLDAAESIADDM